MTCSWVVEIMSFRNGQEEEGFIFLGGGGDQGLGFDILRNYWE